jgi:2,4-dienoyl-CoA reductase-like NADH-dependent reductase (Old Yellow Enzyme family)
VWRQIDTVRQCRAVLSSAPDSDGGTVPIIGTGYSYLQDYLPHVAQAAVREGWTDFVGLGRMVLSYPELPADTLAGRSMQRKQVCRTFSDCTTAPRNGLISGCYPLDPHYKALPERDELVSIKQNWRT